MSNEINGYPVENKKTGRKGFVHENEQMPFFEKQGKLLVRYSDHSEVLYSVKKENLKIIKI